MQAQGTQDFIVKADRAVEAQNVSRVMQVLANAGVARMKIGVSGEE